MLRQTLGWLDEQGKPKRQDIRITYRDLIEKAGVSRGAIGPAIREAIDRGFIECRQQASKKSANSSGQSAEYSLRWDSDGEYTRSPADFNGFFTGDGNRTPVPNQFFDSVVAVESLSVIKVVGTVIRQTVGYQNQFGGRRTSHPLSYSSLQRLANLGDRSTLSLALQVAQERGFIECVETGEFSPDQTKQRTASYGVRWLATANSSANGSKNRPEVEQFKNQTSISSKSRPEDRFKNQTSKEKKISKDKTKQPVAALYDEAVELLVNQGFDAKSSQKLSIERGLDVVQRQIKWIDARYPDNRVAMLRKAIQDDWPIPTAMAERQRKEGRRKNEQKVEERNRAENAEIAETKKHRAERKRRLLQEWESASPEQRERWIQAAVESETSQMIADLIRRQKTTDRKPHVQILEVIAKQRDLPPVLTC